MSVQKYAECPFPRVLIEWKIIITTDRKTRMKRSRSVGSGEERSSGRVSHNSRDKPPSNVTQLFHVILRLGNICNAEDPMTFVGSLRKEIMCIKENLLGTGKLNNNRFIRLIQLSLSVEESDIGSMIRFARIDIYLELRFNR